VIWTLAFWQGAAERGIKTFAQSFLAAVAINTVATPSLGQVNWAQDASIAAVATVLSLITSLGNASFTAGAVAQANAADLLTKNLAGTQPEAAPAPSPTVFPMEATPLTIIPAPPVLEPLSVAGASVEVPPSA